MADVLSQIPGLAGYLAMQGQQRQGAMQDLQGVSGLMSVLQRQEEAQRAAQMAPLQMDLARSQVDEARSKAQSRQALDVAISNLPPEQQAIARLNPQAYVSNLMKRDEPRIIPRGGVLVQDGKPVYSNPVAEPKSSFERILDAAGISDPSQRQQLLGAYLKKQVTHAPAASTTVVMNQEREEAKAVGKASGESFNALQQDALEAGSKINRYNRIGQLLDGVSTGKLAPTAAQIAAFADSVGIKIDPKLGEKQAAEAFANEIALTLRNPSGGAGMPGALSDKDRDFLVSMTPGLSKTPEGNKLIIETAVKLAKRSQEVAKLAREYRAKKGSFGPEFYEELRQYSEANPLFPAAAPAPSGNAGGWSIKRK